MMSTLHRGVMAFVESKSDAREPAGKIAGLLEQDTPRCAQAAVIAGGHRPPPEQLDESRRLVKRVQMRGGEGGAAARYSLYVDDGPPPRPSEAPGSGGRGPA